MSNPKSTDPDLVIIIPANNEEEYIGHCLQALISQEIALKMIVLVYCNACEDNTAAVVQSYMKMFQANGHFLVCLESQLGGKIRSLNAAENYVRRKFDYDLPCAYLDADVVCAPDLIREVYEALSVTQPLYVTGTMRVMDASSRFTQLYSKFWQQLPFFLEGTTGAGFFAVNPAGRARWHHFPDIISDDTFVRLQFLPEERVEVSAYYDWPMAEGFWNLVKVRRRQDKGVREVVHQYPELASNIKGKTLSSIDLLLLFFRMPFGFTTYFLVYLITRVRARSSNWTRIR